MMFIKNTAMNLRLITTSCLHSIKRSDTNTQSLPSNKLEKIEELTNNFDESDARCEELADENLKHTDLIEELRSEIDLQKEELEQKEQLTEGEYEEEKPN